mmetsp:Transcript_59610/g.69648  ORF Transcript_59610/g.69648 Transcript_59610/m.69648 type:complete len:339 (-) Transcript_59610:235-1251(-)
MIYLHIFRCIIFGSILLASKTVFFSDVEESKLGSNLSSNVKRGAQVVPRIVGGTEAEDSRYPYQAIIGDLRLIRSKWTCSGSLIAPDVILTAAHCVKSIPKMGAQLGREDLGDAKETLSRKTKEKRVRKIRKHPRYDEGLIENDVALLFFRSSFRGYDPVLLNTNNAVPSSGQNLTVAGWGATKIGGELNDKKLEAAVTVDEECGADLNITSDTFCATSSESGPCTGDSGGPIISKGTSSTTDVVLGVVSHGIGCKKNSNELYPGIYARVADPDISSWIREEVCKRSRRPPGSFDCVQVAEDEECIDKRQRSCARRANARTCKKRLMQRRCCMSCKKF